MKAKPFWFIKQSTNGFFYVIKRNKVGERFTYFSPAYFKYLNDAIDFLEGKSRIFPLKVSSTLKAA